jgi:hypothetical protein
MITIATGALFCITTSQARQFTYTLTNENPDAFPTFVKLLSFALMPLLCVSILCIAAAIWALLESAGIGFAMIARELHKKVDTWRGLFIAHPEESRDIQDDVMDGLQKFIRIARPFSMLAAVAWVITTTPDINPDKHPSLRAFATVVLVNMDYWPQRVCGHSSQEPAAKLDESHYSIATIQGLHVTLHTESCQTARDQAEEHILNIAEDGYAEITYPSKWEGQINGGQH